MRQLQFPTLAFSPRKRKLKIYELIELCGENKVMFFWTNWQEIRQDLAIV